MKPLQGMTSVEALALTAWQSTSKDAVFSDLCPVDQRGSDLSHLLKRAIQECGDGIQKQRVVVQSLQILENSLTRKVDMHPWVRALKAFFGGASFTKNFELMKETLALSRQLRVDLGNGNLLNGAPQTHLEAFSRFMGEYESRFGAKAPVMKGGEIAEYLLVSERIWNSANVQEKGSDQEKYDVFSDLMEEDAIGTHMLFEESDGQTTLFQEIVDQVGQDPNERSQVRKRVSSHYGAVGSEMQSHIEGNRFRETLFHHGSVGFSDASNRTVFSNGKAAYWKNLNGEEQKGYREMNVTWRQREATPDGPEWKTYLWHRLVDVPLYLFMKKVLHSERPQVAMYKSLSKGRGLPDTTPVLIRAAKEWPQKMAEKTERIWSLRPEFAKM